jgi:hypothetical protein
MSACNYTDYPYNIHKGLTERRLEHMKPEPYPIDKIIRTYYVVYVQSRIRFGKFDQQSAVEFMILRSSAVEAQRYWEYEKGWITWIKEVKI